MNPDTPGHHQTTTERRPSLNILLALTSILISVFLAELILHLAGVAYPSLFMQDRTLGAAHRPDAKGLWRTEGYAHIRINSDGLRDIEHTLTKPAGTLRIAVLGDSYAEAFQVKLQDTFWSVLQNKLRSCPATYGRNIEVINFGVSGYGTAQELIMLQTKVWKYDPDMVLLAFLTGNDFRDNSFALSKTFERPYFFLDNGKMVLQPARVDTNKYPFISRINKEVLFPLFDNSYFAQSLHHLWRILRQSAGPKTASDLKTADGQMEAGLDDWIYLPPATPDQRAAWQVTENLIRQMYGEVRAHGTGFLLATLSNGIQVHPDPVVRNAFAREHGVTDIFYPDRRIAALAERNAIPHAMLAPDLQRWAEEHKSCVHGFSNATLCGGHWNESGHHLAGQILAKQVCQRLGP